MADRIFGEACAHPSEGSADEVNETHLPYLLPWVRINLLIRSITRHTWPEEQWREIKPQLRRALEIRAKLRRQPAWN